MIFTPAIEEIPITINPSTYVDGDVDLDGNLTAHDELFLKKYVLGLYNIIQTGSTDGITINKNGGNCNNIAINGDISTNGHLTFLSWNGNINGELNSIEESIISSNMIVLGNQENINSNITLNSSIMAENDINIKGQVQTSQDSVIYSVDGNITIEASTISYVGIIYELSEIQNVGQYTRSNGTVISPETTPTFLHYTVTKP